MDDDQLLNTQRTLRRRLFEGPGALRWRPGRELAAQMLLYLDEPQSCWRLATEWLRDTLDADRADGGWGGYVDARGQGRCYVAAAEAVRHTLALPSVQGIRFDAADPAIRSVWDCERAAWIDDVAQARSFSPAMRHALVALGTGAKLAIPLRDGGRAVGLMCADWRRQVPPQVGHVADELTAFARDGLGPLMAAARRSGQERIIGAEVVELDAPAVELHGLTPAEMRVARLVARGLSYKEVAREIGRSLSTVDHQLRQVRAKLGVRSTARLVRLLNEQRP
jgi:DNA-binding CsgD family transcriptional regulator